MSWTDERVAQLKRMWGEGRTAAEIAKELGGVTRNAVIGKAHRLKLSNRISPIQQDNKKAAPHAPAPVREKIVAPVAVRAAANQSPVPARGTGINGGVKMVDLKDRMCRWPFGDPKAADFHFCGGPGVPGLPYCPEHAKMAYQAARTRVLQAEDFEEKAEPHAAEEDGKEAVA
jgi:GcrA cell cycle regulator